MGTSVSTAFSAARASSVFLSSYTNTVLNQSTCIFALGYFLRIYRYTIIGTHVLKAPRSSVDQYP